MLDDFLTGKIRYMKISNSDLDYIKDLQDILGLRWADGEIFDSRFTRSTLRAHGTIFLTVYTENKDKICRLGYSTRPTSNNIVDIADFMKECNKQIDITENEFDALWGAE